MKYKFAIFGVKSETNHILNIFSKEIDLVITLDKKTKSAHHISGVSEIDFGSTDFFEADNYKLSSKKCDDFFEENIFELAIVVGWQRLIPKNILSKFKVGVYGFHASPIGLPYGKGRSPLNWSIILGYDHVYNHFFKYNEFVDDGEVFSNTKIEITKWDNIFTLKSKILIDQVNSIKKIIREYKKGSIRLKPQSNFIHETYFPKRKPSDGRINLFSSTKIIYNLIRGCSKPFPGAFLLNEKNEKIIIWDAIPYSFSDLFSTSNIGEVTLIMSNKDFVIKTVDGSILVRDFEADFQISKNLMLK